MKKKVLFAAGAMIIAAAVSAAVCLTCGQTRHNDLFEQNLNALARGESGKYEYPDGYPFTVTCNVSIGDKNKKCKATVVLCQGGGNGCNGRPCPMHN